MRRAILTISPARRDEQATARRPKWALFPRGRDVNAAISPYPLGSGLVQTNKAAEPIHSPWTNKTHHGADKINDTTNTAAMTVTANRLANGAMAPCSSQSSMWGPNLVRSISHARARGDPLANKNAARIMKGVVGKTGRTTPIIPSPKAAHPAMTYIKRDIDTDIRVRRHITSPAFLLARTAQSVITMLGI